MKTESHSINDVLAKNATSFFIPPFQRAFAWGKPEIERYFSDVIRIINSELDEKQNEKVEHFFGTIVITEEKGGFANKSVVVDGQQRLTTTLLFLIALRDLETDKTNQDYITQNYLTNNTSTFQDKIKLKQVTKDWDSYRSLVNKDIPRPGIIYNAYQLFTRLINEKKRLNPIIELKHYITAIQRMNVAVIFLDERPFKGEDPQIIFETLNSLGKPLTLSDLIRNYVLLNMDSNSQSDVYEKIWHPQIESVLLDSTSEFFRDYLQFKVVGSIKVVSDNNTKEIYQLFKNFVENKFNSHKDFISDIVRYVKWYKWIITNVVNDRISNDTNKNREIIELIRNIFHDIKSEAFKPFVLGLLEYHQSGVDEVKLGDDLLISILETIRTYLIRRRTIGLTQGENKNIVLLCNKIEDLAKKKESMLNLLTSMSYRMRLPNDLEMKRVLESINFYEGLKSYSKFILGKIAEHNTKVSVDFRNKKITIEHIMPQKLEATWIKDLGENHNEIHKQYLHNIGNLILTEFNSEIGNKSFSDKKKKLYSSSLNYRLSVINKDIWNQESILLHQKNMISWFLETFNLPETHQEISNWNTMILEDTKFSPLDKDAGDMAEGNKPLELHIENKTFKVSTWQDVFLKFLHFIYNNQNYDFNILIENQSELFGKNDVIVNLDQLFLLIDNNNELTKKYKTFGGKIWDKAEEIHDNELFIHINISASYCMNRVASIMNKFNMEENSVEIFLK